MSQATRWRSLAARHLTPVAVVIAAVACGSGRDPIRIGLAGPFSDSVGAPMERAARLAVLEINSAGGIRGRPIELVARDDFGESDSAVAVAKALEAAGVVAVVGHVYSGTTLAAAPIYNGAARPVVAISPSSSSPDVTFAGPYTFRVCPSDLQQGAALARFVRDRLGLDRGTVLYLNDEYGRGIRSVFATEFVRRGGVVEDQAPYLGASPDVDAYLDRLARRRTSQFIFIAGNRSEAEVALRGARARNLRMPFVGGDGLEGLEEAGPLAEGTFISSAYSPGVESPRNRKFLDAYRQEYPRSNLPNQPAAATYDILYLLRDIIGRVGTDRARIRDAVAATGNSEPAFEGVTGSIAFDGNGDVPTQRVLITTVQDGRVALVEGQ